ncbi:MAG: outer membrane lipoprotein carrier protein [Gammaproteobacteria bacterium]
MREFLSSIVVIGLCVSGFSVNAEQATAGRARLTNFLSELTTLRGHFQQQLFDEYGELMESAEGDVIISKPGKFRWEYQQPYHQIIVTNGATIWIYDADLEQVSVNPFTNDGGSSPAALLSGDLDIEQHFTSVDSAGEGDIIWVSLTPRDAGATYHGIDLGLTSTGLSGMKLRDNLNQLTSIAFSEIERNSDVADTEFEFVPPAGVDVISGTGD